MPSKKPDAAKIEFFVCASIRGPIVPGDYDVGMAAINVSYPEQIHLGFPTPLSLPKGISTLFIVSWLDDSGTVEHQLRSKSHERHLPIYEALRLISQLLLAYK